ncbi:class I SAM-dependent methyltransferase [Gracilimonas sp.]|uniref:class I SAM-dependent methyltransferase n=1 Tax=Gracilimonas sp. TaxID=1974203 RepID=UPI0032EC5462
MTQSEAIRLIEEAGFKGNQAEKWVDLGCGSGLFSYALAQILSKDSHILMVDKVNQAPIKSSVHGIHLEFLQMDFSKQQLPKDEYDGILMANSLHYVKNKKTFIQKLTHHLSENGRLVIVEYGTNNANPWIPYPITLRQLEELFKEEGFKSVRKIGERPSRYGHKNMYAAEVR